VPVSLILLFTVRGVAGFVAQYALAKVTNEGLQALRRAMFGKLLSSRLSLFADQSSSAIANTVVYEVFNGSSMMINAVMKLARDILTLAALVAYLLFLNWKLMLIVSLLFPAVALVIQLLTRRLYRLTRESQVATDNLAYVVEENVLAHRDVRLHGAQAGQASRFEALSNTLRRLSIKSTVAYAGMSAITQVLAAMALSAVISIALLQGSENTTTVGGFVAFVTAMLLLIAPIKSLSDGATPITRGLAALERGLDLVDLIDDESSGSFTKARVAGGIEFSGVSVVLQAGRAAGAGRHQPGHTRRRNRGAGRLLRVRQDHAGEPAAALCGLQRRQHQAGRHGAAGLGPGVPALAVRLRQPARRDVQQQHGLQRRAGPVLRPRQGRQRLAAANLGQLLEELPQGIDTVLGHNAMQLSGGQRQRLAIARALYKDAPVLILDEATSALDTESEKAVQEAIQRLAAGRTSLIIAHRLSTIQHADRIIMMNAGRIVEQGSHAELLHNNGAYAHLYRLGFQGAA
jgi:subfamily B ATP-binding cassette protein MsbA